MTVSTAGPVVLRRDCPYPLKATTSPALISSACVVLRRCRGPRCNAAHSSAQREALRLAAGSAVDSRSEILACPGRGKLRKDDHHSNELKVFRNHSIPERYQSAHLRRRDMQKLDGSENCRPTAARSSTWDRRITCGRNLVDSLSSRLKRGSFRPPKIGSPDPRLAWTSTSVDDQGFVPGTR